jgi:hypothetical protein
MTPRIAVPFGLLAACLLVSGCLTLAPPSDESCWSCTGQRMVRIDPTDSRLASSRNRPFTHPLALPQSQWEAIVRSVQVQSIHRPLAGASYHGGQEPAFTVEEARYLGEALQRAFQEVTAEQRVVFALERTGEAGLPQLTSGAWFVDQDQIHLRVANLRITVTMPGIRKLVRKDPLAAQPGIFYELVPGDHQLLQKDVPAAARPFQDP